jgi:hypothetical protein
MERHLRDATPRYALVVWPDEADQQQPSCIELAGVPDAITYGAIIVALEDATFCQPRPRPFMDMRLLSNQLLSNQVRKKPQPPKGDDDGND